MSPEKPVSETYNAKTLAEQIVATKMEDYAAASRRGEITSRHEIMMNLIVAVEVALKARDREIERYKRAWEDVSVKYERLLNRHGEADT